jgi:hypothetical protein
MVSNRLRTGEYLIEQSNLLKPRNERRFDCRGIYVVFSPDMPANIAASVIKHNITGKNT